MLANIRQNIGGAKPLYVSALSQGSISLLRGDKTILIDYICIGQYENQDGFYLFGCDKAFKTYTDYWYDNLDEALNDAKRLYGDENIEWTQIG